MKIKSFTGYSADELERKINSWLEKEKDIEIVEVSQSQSPSEGEMVVLIFYKKHDTNYK